MTVYVDGVNIRADVPNGARTVRGVWCHMTADTREELDAMADRIGLRRAWIQHPGTWKEHYDLTQSKKRLALAAGAVEAIPAAMSSRCSGLGAAPCRRPRV